MESPDIVAVVVYGCLALIMLLLSIAARDGFRERYPVPDFPLAEAHGMVILSWIALWLLIGSLIFAGVVDLTIWFRKDRDPSVSDLIHYYLNLYPWVGWIIAGLVYHFLVDRPAPPWR